MGYKHLWFAPPVPENTEGSAWELISTPARLSREWPPQVSSVIILVWCRSCFDALVVSRVFNERPSSSMSHLGYWMWVRGRLGPLPPAVIFYEAHPSPHKNCTCALLRFIYDASIIMAQSCVGLSLLIVLLQRAAALCVCTCSKLYDYIAATRTLWSVAFVKDKCLWSKLRTCADLDGCSRCMHGVHFKMLTILRCFGLQILWGYWLCSVKQVRMASISANILLFTRKPQARFSQHYGRECFNYYSCKTVAGLCEWLAFLYYQLYCE